MCGESLTLSCCTVSELCLCMTVLIMWDMFLVSHKYMALWLVLVRSAIKDRNSLPLEGVGLMKQRTSHPAQQCPLVVAIDKRFPFGKSNQSLEYSVYTQWGSEVWIHLWKCLLFVLSNLIYFPPSQITLSAQCKLEKVTWSSEYLSILVCLFCLNHSSTCWCKIWWSYSPVWFEMIQRKSYGSKNIWHKKFIWSMSQICF